MHLVTFAAPGQSPHVGVVVGSTVLDLTAAFDGDGRFQSMLALIDSGQDALDRVRSLLDDAGDAMSTFAAEIDQVQLQAPIPRPRKNVFCVGLNYRSHVEQNAAALGMEPVIPETPLFFSKPVTAVIGPDASIRHDARLTDKLDYEVELAIVIGPGGYWIDPAQARNHIFGYTIANDVSARDLQWRNGQFLYGKGQDTYCPLGPAIVTPDEVPVLDDIMVELYVNGELRQHESADHMIFQPETVVSELSRGITLEPGDIILLGTPGGCGYQLQPPRFLQPGDIVEARATGMGSLTNPVVAYPPG